MEQQCIVCVLACVEKCMCVCMHVCGGQRSWGYFLGVNQLTFCSLTWMRNFPMWLGLRPESSRDLLVFTYCLWNCKLTLSHPAFNGDAKDQTWNLMHFRDWTMLSHNKLFSCRKMHCPIDHMKTLSLKVFIKKSPGIIVVEFCDSLIIDIATVLLGSGYLYAPSFIYWN